MDALGQFFVQLPQAPMPIVEGSEAWQSVVGATQVDLGDPSSICSVPLSVLPQPQAGSHDILILSATTSTLIALCQQAIGEVLSSMLQSPRSVTISGVYDCESAQAMVGIADLIGQDTASATTWPLGVRELRYLLTSSRLVQQVVQDSTTKTGGAVALNPGLFTPALPPAGCAVPIDPFGTSGGAAVVAYGDQPDAVSGNGPTKSANGWLLPVGVGILLGALGAEIHAGSTQRRGQHG